jgi:hypothetical protein
MTIDHCSGLMHIFNRYIDTQASPVPDEAHIEMYNSKRLVDGNQGQPTTLYVACMQCSVLKSHQIFRCSMRLYCSEAIVQWQR